jgi:hypothetical protein
MFECVNARAGTRATLHSLRHTASYRMAEDPQLPLTDVQLVLGHASLTTTQLYTTPREEDVIRRMLTHHSERTSRHEAGRIPPAIAPEYRRESLADERASSGFCSGGDTPPRRGASQRATGDR